VLDSNVRATRISLVLALAVHIIPVERSTTVRLESGKSSRIISAVQKSVRTAVIVLQSGSHSARRLQEKIWLVTIRLAYCGGRARDQTFPPAVLRLATTWKGAATSRLIRRKIKVERQVRVASLRRCAVCAVPRQCRRRPSRAQVKPRQPTRMSARCSSHFRKLHLLVDCKPQVARDRKSIDSDAQLLLFKRFIVSKTSRAATTEESKQR